MSPSCVTSVKLVLAAVRLDSRRKTHHFVIACKVQKYSWHPNAIFSILMVVSCSCGGAGEQNLPLSVIRIWVQNIHRFLFVWYILQFSVNGIIRPCFGWDTGIQRFVSCPRRFKIDPIIVSRDCNSIIPMQHTISWYSSYLRSKHYLYTRACHGHISTERLLQLLHRRRSESCLRSFLREDNNPRGYFEFPKIRYRTHFWNFVNT